jgi:hypothetical protein
MPDELVTIARFSNLVAAELARSDLESAGIRAVYFQSNGLLSSHDVQLQIAATDADRALAVLAKTKNHAKHRAKRTAHSGAQSNVDLAASEGSAKAIEDLTPREKAADRAIFAALVGIPLPPLAIYVLWQIGIVILSHERLSPRMRNRALWAGVLSLLDVALLVLWLLTF